MATKSKKFRRDKKSKVNSIIEATVALIKEQGYSGFSVDEIPDRANLSIGTIYRYFPNGKSDILNEILKRNAKMLLELITLDEKSKGAFRDFWSAVITAYLRGHRESLFDLTATEYSLWSNPLYTEIVEPIYFDFLQKLVSQTSGFEAFTSLKEKDLISRMGFAVGIVGLFVRHHVKNPLFGSDETLVKYLTEISLLAFEIEQ